MTDLSHPNLSLSLPRRTGGALGLLLCVSLVACKEDRDLDDMGGPGDMAQNPMEARPMAVTVSATGHDRFFGVAYDAQGRFYAVGVVADSTEATADYRMLLARFTATGALDKSFGQGGFATHNVIVGTNGELARGIAVQSSGKIVISGTVEHIGATDARDRDVALVRFNGDGTLDRTFGNQGLAILDLSDGEVAGMSYVADSTWGLVRDSSDRLIVHAAQKRAGATDTDFAMVRLTADGMIDTSFGDQGRTTLDINNRSASPRSVILLPDGSIIGAGYFNDGGPVKPVLYKLDTSGKLDQRFGNGGYFSQGVLAAATEAYAVALQGTSLVTTGYGRNEASESLDWVSLRVTQDGALDPSYGTGGFARLDVAGFNDNSRTLMILPDSRVLLLGGGRPVEANVDGMIAVLTMNGQPDTSFTPKGFKLYDVGGPADHFWGGELSPDRKQIAIVGLRGAGEGGNDDAAVMLLPLPR